MPPEIVYRRGGLEDLSKFRIADDLGLTTQSIEYNVVGVGHEFWIAVENNRIVALTAIGRTSPGKLTVMYLQVSPSHKYRGVGSALLRTVIENYPECEFSVVPFEGTEAFYRRLGFESVSQWEMKRTRSSKQDDSSKP